mgnify:CR=1 FL=1
MAKEIKTIGVLTSGGDAPGMNAAVRAIVRAGISKGYRMMGIQRGYNGLINGEVYEMNVRSVSEIIHRGGTILYTARCLEFKTKEGQAKGLARCKELGIDVIDLGLVYGIEIDELGRAIITMTLTTPACPLTDLIEDECASTLAGLVEEFRIDWTWQPRWTMDKITPEGREQLAALGFNFDNMPKY